MNLEYLRKEDRTTQKISSKLIDEIVCRLEGLENGTVGILVKGGVVLGIEVLQRTHFSSNLQGGSGEQPKC